MKYWKIFWNNLNLGWKRIHYIMLFILFVPVFIGVIFLFGFVEFFEQIKNLKIIGGIVFSILTTYLVLISTIIYVREGFKKNN